MKKRAVLILTTLLASTVLTYSQPPHFTNGINGCWLSSWLQASYNCSALTKELMDRRDRAMPYPAGELFPMKEYLDLVDAIEKWKESKPADPLAERFEKPWQVLRDALGKKFPQQFGSLDFNQSDAVQSLFSKHPWVSPSFRTATLGLSGLRISPPQPYVAWSMVDSKGDIYPIERFEKNLIFNNKAPRYLWVFREDDAPIGQLSTVKNLTFAILKGMETSSPKAITIPLEEAEKKGYTASAGVAHYELIGIILATTAHFTSYIKDQYDPVTPWYYGDSLGAVTKQDPPQQIEQNDPRQVKFLVYKQVDTVHSGFAAKSTSTTVAPLENLAASLKALTGAPSSTMSH